MGVSRTAYGEFRRDLYVDRVIVAVRYALYDGVTRDGSEAMFVSYVRLLN